MHIGVISDTHSLVRPEALAALRGSELILHAGDICEPAVLEALAAIAPVRAVRGNNDKGAWAKKLSETDIVDVAGRRIYMIHDVKELDLDPAAAGFDVVVAGHSHKPRNEVVGGVLFFNPGSAGPRRFSLPITLGRLEVDRRGVRGQIIALG
jgi:putative phosphoesterase